MNYPKYESEKWNNTKFVLAACPVYENTMKEKVSQCFNRQCEAIFVHAVYKMHFVSSGNRFYFMIICSCLFSGN